MTGTGGCSTVSPRFLAAFAASIDETGALKLGNEFFHLLRHEIFRWYFVE